MQTFPKIVKDVDQFNEISPFHFAQIQQIVFDEYNAYCWFEEWVNDGIHASGSLIYLSHGDGRFCVSPVQTGDSFAFAIKKLSE